MNIFRLLGDMSHLATYAYLIARLREKRNCTGISLKTQELLLLVFITRYLDLFTNFYSMCVLLPRPFLQAEATAPSSMLVELTPHPPTPCTSYNSLMKVVYLAASSWVVYMMRVEVRPSCARLRGGASHARVAYPPSTPQEPWKSTYEDKLDTFLHIKFAIAPCAVLALVLNEGSIKAGVASYLFEVCWAFSIYLEAIAIVPQLIMTQRHKAVENITSFYMASLGAYRGLYVLNWVYRFFAEPHYRAWIPWVAGVIQTLFFADFLYYFYICRIKLGMSAVILPQ